MASAGTPAASSNSSGGTSISLSAWLSSSEIGRDQFDAQPCRQKTAGLRIRRVGQLQRLRRLFNLGRPRFAWPVLQAEARGGGKPHLHQQIDLTSDFSAAWRSDIDPPGRAMMVRRALRASSGPRRSRSTRRAYRGRTRSGRPRPGPSRARSIGRDFPGCRHGPGAAAGSGSGVPLATARERSRAFTGG